MVPKIFVFCEPAPNWGPTEVYAQSVSEDGVGLGGHLCSCEGWVRHDMGFGDSKWHHEDYIKHYPNGFELVYVEQKDIDTHEGLQKAFELNKQRNQE